MLLHLGDWEHATATERLEELRVRRWACVLRRVWVKCVAAPGGLGARHRHGAAGGAARAQVGMCIKEGVGYQCWCTSGDWEHATATERLEELRVRRWACVLRRVWVKGVTVYLGDWEHATATERLEELRVRRWACVLRRVWVTSVGAPRATGSTPPPRSGWRSCVCAGGHVY